MAAIPSVAWLVQLLRWLPQPVLIALDAWSAGVARGRAQRRRQRTLRAQRSAHK
jgi:hypothetical protein